MITKKTIVYDQIGRVKTPMQVLHSILSEMQLSSFERKRISIYEDYCHARIEYSLKSYTTKKWNFLTKIMQFDPKNGRTIFTLDINVVSDNHKLGQFIIYSEITPDGEVLKDVARSHPTPMHTHQFQ